MDIFSNQRSFFLKGQTIFYTSLGGCLTISIFCLSLLFFFYSSSSWILQDYYKINKFQMFNDDALGWNTSAKIIISFPKSIERKIVFFRDFSYTQELVLYHDCSPQEYSMYYEKPPNSSLAYKCGNLMEPGTYDHTLYAVNCSYMKKNNLLVDTLNCTEDPSTDEINFEYLIYSERYNTLAAPLKITKYMLKNVDLKDSNHLKLFFTFNKVVDYDYFENIKEITYFTDIVNIAPSSKGSDIIFSIDSFKDDSNASYLSNLQIEVKQNKIETILAMVFAVFNIIFTLCFYVNNFINDFQLKKYVLTLILDDLDFMMRVGEIKEEMENEKKISLNISSVEFLMNIYTFKNNLKFELHLLNTKTKQLIKLINDKIIEKLSIENFQQKNFEFNKSQNNTGILSKISSFLRKCDFMAPGITFVIKKRKKFSTLSGKIFTLIYIISLGLLFFFFGGDYWYQKPNLSQIQSVDYLNKEAFAHEIPIMIYLPKEVDAYYNITYFNRSSAEIGLTNFTRCTASDFLNFEKIPDDYFSYWCNNIKYYFTLHPDLWEDVYISLMDCYRLNLAGFNNTGCINIQVNNLSNITVGVSFLSQSLDLYNIDINPHNIVYERNYTVSPNEADKSTIEYDFHFAQQEVNDCQGAFLCEYKNKRFSTFYNSSVFYYGSDLDNLVDFYFRYHIHLTWNRQYTKIYEMLAQIMSMGNILWIFFYLCNVFLENYFFFKLFKEDFLQKRLKFHKLPKKAQENLKILMEKNDLPNFSVKIDNLTTKNDDLMFKSTTSNNNTFSSDFREVIDEKILTFKNYLLYRMFGKSFDSFILTIYEAIYQEMIICSSFETFLKIKNDVKDSKMDRFLRYFDCLSENRFIHYKKYYKYTTWFGGVFSLIKLALMIIFLVIFGSNFWYRENPKFSSYTSKFYELDPNQFDRVNIPIMLYYQRNLSNYMYFSNEDYADDGKMKTNFGMWDCTKNDSNFFNIPLNPEKIYKCSNVGAVLNFNLKNLGSIEGNFHLVDCEDKRKQCELQRTDEFYMIPENTTIPLGFKFNISTLKEDDPYHPIHNEWIELEGDYIPFTLPKAEYDLRNNILYNDNGWLIPHTETFVYYSVINVNLKPHRGKGMLVAFTVVTPDVSVLKREYMKFPELLANVFAMINILNAILIFIYQIVNNYYFYLELAENVKSKNFNQKFPKIYFIKFLFGEIVKVKQWNKDYSIFSRHFCNIFSFEGILLGEINRRFSLGTRLEKKATIAENIPIQMEIITPIATLEKNNKEDNNVFTIKSEQQEEVKENEQKNKGKQEVKKETTKEE